MLQKEGIVQKNIKTYGITHSRKCVLCLVLRVDLTRSLKCYLTECKIAILGNSSESLCVKATHIQVTFELSASASASTGYGICK